MNKHVIWESKDILALLVVTGCFVLLYAGKDGVIVPVLTSVVGFMLGGHSERARKEKEHEG